METLRKIVRALIVEEIGRSYHTVNNMPYDFTSFKDYEIEINPTGSGNYLLAVFFRGKKITASASFQNYEDALHRSRMIVDKHRVTAMNKNLG